MLNVKRNHKFPFGLALEILDPPGEELRVER
jgi:hypothetical protein